MMAKLEQIGKIPPQAIELEQAVIGALMLESETFERISHLLKNESFYESRHGQIFDVIADMKTAQKPVDLLTVTRELTDRGILDSIGGASYITGLSLMVSSAAHIERYARVIAEKYAARDLIRVCSEIQTKAFDSSSDIENLLSEFKMIAEQIDKHFEANDIGTPQREVAKETLIEIHTEVANNRKGEINGISTGFSELDRALGGWKPTNLIIIAARPGVGKTSLALHFATIAAQKGHWVNFFSLEMTKNQLFKIMLSGDSDVNRTTIRDGRLSDSDLIKIEKSVGRLETLPISWYDKEINPNNLKSIISRNLKAGRCGMVVIDYLQLISPSDKRSIREQQIAEISRTLKAIALDLRIPVICLSQLNRLAESEMPKLHHLRESGAIEQDADVVIFPFRPEPERFCISIAKSRNGRIGGFDVWANDQMTRFADYKPINAGTNGSLEMHNPDRNIEPDSPEDLPF
jgi:replicative DNA helicase